MSGMNIELALLTDVGQKRTNNQDYVNHFINRAGKQMIILADGMGGHRAGNIASEMAVTDLGAAWVDTHIDSVQAVCEWFNRYLEEENQKIAQMGQSDEYQGMGTTLEAVTFVEGQAVFAHVGDSRISLIRDGEMVQLTSDHSLVNELLKAGQITVEEAENHPQRNIITQSIGQEGAVNPDLGSLEMHSGDYLVINSDGLSNMVSNHDIFSIVSGEASLSDKASNLIHFANEAGGLDNITVALVQVHQEASE